MGQDLFEFAQVTGTPDLSRQVRLILGQVTTSTKIYRYTEKDIAAERVRLERNPEDEPAIDFTDSAVNNEQVVLLKTLYAQSGHSEKFIEVLSKEVNEMTASVVVHTLVELGNLRAVLAILGTIERDDLSLPGAIWSGLGEKLRREPQRFTDADLDEIDAIRSMEFETLRSNWKRFTDDRPIPF